MNREDTASRAPGLHSEDVVSQHPGLLEWLDIPDRDQVVVYQSRLSCTSLDVLHTELLSKDCGQVHRIYLPSHTAEHLALD